MAHPGHFYECDGDSFVPTTLAHGYWQPDTLSGAAAASLLGHAIERDWLASDWVPVRLSVDMLRMPPAAALRVETEVLHESRRLRLIEARLLAAGQVQTRALCQIVRRGSQPDNPVWQSPPWPAPHPDALPAGPRTMRWEMRAIPADHGRFVRSAPLHDAVAGGNPPVLGELAPISARQAWINTAMEVVAGHPVSPWLKLVLTADFASPLAHSSETGIDFVNTDFTIHLHRMPQGPWIGYELTGHTSSDGVAVGHCAIHDTSGPLGVIVVSAMANSRRR